MVYTLEALGELFIHVQNLNYYSTHEHQRSHAMLFGPFGCHLIVCQGQELLSREIVEWNTPGSLNKLKEFFPSFKWDLSPFLQAFQVQIIEPQEDNETAFLGSGAFGRVVHVVNQSGDDYALKVVELNHFTRLTKEYGILNQHKNCNCNLIASIPDFSQIHVSKYLCGFLLSPVGVGLTREKIKNEQLIEKVVELLSSLHLHNPPYIHGDSRISNIIQKSDGSLTWIDLCDGTFLNGVFDYGFFCDMKILVESILKDVKINETLLREYSHNPSQTQNIVNFLKNNI